MIVTPVSERIAGPMPSQSMTPGLFGYSVVSTTYRLRKLAAAMRSQPMRQRHDRAARIAPTMTNG